MSIKQLLDKLLRSYWLGGLWLCGTVGCYLSVLVPPRFFWPAIFTSYAIPVILGLNVLLLIALLLLRKNRASLLPVLCLLFGIPFILVTYNMRGGDGFSAADLTLLSYNTRYFNTNSKYTNFSPEGLRWIRKDSSDVKCLQEIRIKQDHQAFSLAYDSLKASHDHFVFIGNDVNREKNDGMAIFTKGRIIDKGFVWRNPGSLNAGMYADISIEGKTIRVYNVHLESMGLEIYQYKERNAYPSKVKSLIQKLKWGAEKRSEQIRKLLEHASESPHPFVICGDFNDTPYSYNYFKLRRSFPNTFEQAGNGFGFTFNSMLFFLRIDHQFFGENVEALDLRVDRSITLSDHFPIRGRYNFEGVEQTFSGIDP